MGLCVDMEPERCWAPALLFERFGLSVRRLSRPLNEWRGWSKLLLSVGDESSLRLRSALARWAKTPEVREAAPGESDLTLGAVVVVVGAVVATVGAVVAVVEVEAVAVEAVVAVVGAVVLATDVGVLLPSSSEAASLRWPGLSFCRAFLRELMFARGAALCPVRG